MSDPNLTGNAPSRGQATTSRELLSVIFRRKWLILGLFLVVTSTVLAIAFTTPVSYVSSGRVLVLRGERTSALTPGRQVYNDWETDLGSENEVAKSYPVIQRAREKLAEEAKNGGRVVKLDAKSVDVEVMGKSNVLGIGYSDLDPNVAQQACDAMINAYLEYRQGQARLGKPETFFETELTGLKAQIDSKLDQRRRLSSASGVIDPESQSRAYGDQITTVERSQLETEGQLAEAQGTIDALRAIQANKDLDIGSLPPPFTNDTALEALSVRITEQQARIATLRERFRDDAPEVQNATTTLETLQTLLHKEFDTRLRVAQSRIDVLQARLAVYNQDIANYRKKLEGMPQSQSQLGELDDQIKTLRDRYAELAKSRDQERITANTSSDYNVVLLSPAGPPLPRNTRDYVRLALAPAFSLVVGIGLAFFIDGLDLTVRTANQAEEFLDLPVLASLQERRSKRG